MLKREKKGLRLPWFKTIKIRSKTRDMAILILFIHLKVVSKRIKALEKDRKQPSLIQAFLFTSNCKRLVWMRLVFS